ncbi:RHS repeat-associated core domain-containing protein [Isoptericola sp. NPDC056578]|uniref:RHS repeat-associated core domain-containing protein n=1 Tax=Isoptericola sp. NPDC056578 TaxID=3345870 RepID=UPI0036D01E45
MSATSYGCGSEQQVADSGWTTASWQIPSGILQSNTTYRWEVSTDVAGDNPSGSFFNDWRLFSTGATLTIPTGSAKSVQSAPADTAILTTARPELAATITRPLSGTTYVYQFSVRAKDDSLQWTSAWGSAAKITIPANILDWNKEYEWSVSIKTQGGIIGTLFDPSRSFYVIVPPSGNTGAESDAPIDNGVSTADGALTVESSDASLILPGGDITIGRKYRSVQTATGAFGRGWTSLLDMRVTESTATQTLRVTFADGTTETFGKNGDGTYAPSLGTSGVSVSKCEGCAYWTVTADDGYSYDLDSLGPVAISNPAGVRASVERDTATSTPVRISSSTRSLDIKWSGGTVRSVSANPAPSAGARVWTYDYASSLLTRVCSPLQGADPHCNTFQYKDPTTTSAITNILSPSGKETMAVNYASAGVVSSLAKSGQTARIFTRSTTALGGITVSAVENNGVNAKLYQLDAFNRIVRQEDALGGVQRWEYDDYGRLLKYFDEAGGGLAFDYDDAGHITRRSTWREPDKYTSQCYSYHESNDARSGKLRSVSDPRYLSCDDPLVSYEYDEEGRLSEEIIGEQANAEDAPRTRYTYSEGTTAVPRGRLSAVELPSGAKTIYTYGTSGFLTSYKNPDGLETAYTYDALGRATSVRTSGPGVVGGTTVLTWNDDNSPESITEPGVVDVSGAERQVKYLIVRDGDGNVTETRASDVVSGAELPATRVLYDSAGRVIERLLPGGGKETLRYDEHGRLSSVVDASGAANRTEYDALSRPISTTLADYVDPVTGKTRDVILSEIEYTPTGLAAQVHQVGEPVRHFTYQLDGSLTKVTADGAGGDGNDVIEFEGEYDELGNLISRKTPSTEFPTTYSYDKTGRVSEVSQGFSLRTVFTYTPGGLRSSATSYSSGNVVAKNEYAYNMAGRLSSTTSGFGESTSTSWYDYDALGRITRSVDPRAAGPTDSEWSTDYAYDALGDLTSVTYPMVVASGAAQRPKLKYSYDAVGRLEAVVAPDGTRQEVVYDEAGRIAEALEPSVLMSDGTSRRPATSWQYDDSGRVIAETRPDGATTRFEYDGAGRVVRRHDPATTGGDERTTMIRWSDAGAPLEAIDASGRKRTWSYDQAGRISDSTVWDHENGFTTTYRYDDSGRLVETISPDGSSSTTTYDYRGLRESETDADGITTRYLYDALGKLTRSSGVWASSIIEYNELGLPVKTSREALGGEVLDTSSSVYDKAGNVTSTSGPLGTGAAWTWDALNRVTSESAANGDSWTLSYGEDGALEMAVNPLGRATTIDRDALGRPIRVTEPSTSAHPDPGDRTWNTTYDIIGNPIAETQPGGVTIERQFDVDGNLLREEGSGGGTVPATRSFTYDPVGRVVSASHPDGEIGFEYDGRGLLTSSTGGAGSSTLAYDAVGRLSSWTDEAGDGAATWTPAGRLESVTAGGGERGFSYDSSGNLAEESGPDWSRTYTRDPLGRVTKVSATGPSKRYQWSGAYDQAGRLVEETVAPTQAAGAGTTTYRYDELSRLVGWTGPDTVGHNQAFDGAGNLTSVDSKRFTYDDRNRLLSDGDAAYTWHANGDRASMLRASTTTEYEFDGLGRMTSAGDEDLTYDAFGRIAADGTSVFKYRGKDSEPVVTGSTAWQRVGARILSTDGDVVVQNQRGDLVARESAAGDLTSSTDYSPWGASPDLTATLGFQGQWTSDQGLVHMGSRWYDPSSSSFVSRDSAKVPLSQGNRYAYAAGNPITGTDNTGQFAPPVLVAPILAPAAAAAAASGPPGWLIGGAVVGVAAAGYVGWSAYQWSQRPGVPEFDYSPGRYGYSGASHGYSSPGSEFNYSSYPTTYGGTSYNYYGGTSRYRDFAPWDLSDLAGHNGDWGLSDAWSKNWDVLDNLTFDDLAGPNGDWGLSDAWFRNWDVLDNLTFDDLAGPNGDWGLSDAWFKSMDRTISILRNLTFDDLAGPNGDWGLSDAWFKSIDQTISKLDKIQFEMSGLDLWGDELELRDATPVYIRSSPGSSWADSTGTIPLNSAEICARAAASLCEAVNAGTNVGHSPVDLKTTLVPRASVPADPAGVTGIRPAPTHYSAPEINQSAAYDYQRQRTGMLEFEVSGGGESIWADGVEGSTLVDTKYVTNPKSSPYTGTGPRFLQDGVREELRRYGEVIADPRTPYDNLELVTNDETAATFLGELLEEYDVPGRITLDP